MRKILLFIFLTIFNYCAFAQDSKALSYVEVVPVENTTANELFDRAEIWVSQTFKNPDKVTRIKNKENGQIILNPSMNFDYSKTYGRALVKGTINYVIKINSREGRYRIEITDFYHTASSSFGLITTSEEAPRLAKREAQSQLKWEKEVWDEVRVKVKREIAIIASSIKQYMAVQDSSVEDDW